MKRRKQGFRAGLLCLDSVRAAMNATESHQMEVFKRQQLTTGNFGSLTSRVSAKDDNSLYRFVWFYFSFSLRFEKKQNATYEKERNEAIFREQFPLLFFCPLILHAFKIGRG